MSISSEVRRAGPYAGNGSTVAFAFSFKVFATSQVRVTRTTSGTEAVLTLTTDYSVSLNANQNTNPGGTVTMVTAPTTAQTVTITSNVANLQPTAIANLGGFYPEVINDSLDRATIQIQQLDERLDRALVIPVSSSGIDTELPAPESSKLIGWDSAGTGLVNYSNIPVGSTTYQYVHRTIATAGQTAFALPITYTVGASALTVYVNGLRVEQGAGLDYLETNNTTITFTSGLAAGDLVVVAIHGDIDAAATPPNYTVESIAALRLLTTATAATELFLLYNYVAGDGGGAFRYDSTDTTTADNGGTVIVDAAGRRWKRQFDGPVNVQWFGANGSGATDALALSANTTAFRACETYVSGLTDGGSIYIPRGRYFLGDQVVCNGAGKTITWFGDGYDSIVTLINNSPMKFFYVDSTSLLPAIDSAPCIFKDFQISTPQGSGALNNGAISIYTDNRKLTLIGMTISGRIGVQLGSNAFGSQLLDCNISNCTHQALYTANDKSANNLVVRGGEYFSNGQEGTASAFEILNGDAILFDGVQIEGNFNGIQCRDVQSLKINSCYIELSTNVNFYIASGTSKSIALTESWFGVQGATTTLENCEKVDIESCTFYGLNPGECTWTTGATGLNINFAGSNTLLGSATWVPGAGTFRVLTSYHSSTTPTAPTAGTTLHLAQADASVNRLFMDSCDQTSALNARRRNGSYSSPTAIQNNDTLLSISAGGYDGAAFGSALASVSMRAAQNWSSGATGTFIEFSTTANGAASASVRVGIANDGGVYGQLATGGSQGNGTSNWVGVYDDGVLICSPLNADIAERATLEFWNDQIPQAIVEHPAEIQKIPAILHTDPLTGETSVLQPEETKVVKEAWTERPKRRRHRTAKRHFDMAAQGFDASNPEIYFAWLERDRAVPGIITLEEWNRRNPKIDGVRIAKDKQTIHERTERTNLALDYMALTIKAMWEEIKMLRGSALANAPAAPFMPADLAALALPDESLADLKVRLLTELTRLRSMAVGRLDMTDAERAMLTTLEGQVAQQWFSS